MIYQITKLRKQGSRAIEEDVITVNKELRGQFLQTLEEVFEDRLSEMTVVITMDFAVAIQMSGSKKHPIYHIYLVTQKEAPIEEVFEKKTPP